MPHLNLIELHQIPIFEQLQLEEALLRTNSENWCLINYGSPPAIVMGISGKPHQLVNRERLIEDPIPLIRRFSGGGTVVIDSSTFFVTFICSDSFADIELFPHSIMNWTETIYRPLFEGENFSLRENDYVLGDRKFGGNAQSIIKNRWLHHSSFLWNFCPNKMDYLHLPHKTPAYRKGRGHHDFLCTLNHRWSSLELMKMSVIDRLRQLYELKRVCNTQLSHYLEKPHRKMTQYHNI